MREVYKIRPLGGERGVRTYRLGVGYSEQDLEYRLENRDREYTIPAIMQKYKGIQLEYAYCLRKIQIVVYHKQPNPRKHTIRDIQQLGNVLTYMHRNNIHSRSGFESKVGELSAAHEVKNAELAKLNAEIEKLQKTCDDYYVFKPLEDTFNASDMPIFTEEERQEYLRTEYCRRYTTPDIERMRGRIAELSSQAGAMQAEV